MRSWLQRLLFLFQRNQFDRDLQEELRFHEEMKANALADAEGMSGDEARAAARRRIGNPLRLREQSREPWSFVTIEEGSLYPALQRMRVKGWVLAEWQISANNRRARFYTLTTAGKKQLGVEESRFSQMFGAIMRVMKTT